MDANSHRKRGICLTDKASGNKVSFSFVGCVGRERTGTGTGTVAQKLRGASVLSINVTVAHSHTHTHAISPGYARLINSLMIKLRRQLYGRRRGDGWTDSAASAAASAAEVLPPPLNIANVSEQQQQQ
ncbi:hypothetical protein RB195_012858 [Necator americanus]|uniref:Uncharacterized protein n=1 Tax=Necator americanus TaxID=51031 RepID=A0ABR1DT11_NECAM